MIIAKPSKTPPSGEVQRTSAARRRRPKDKLNDQLEVSFNLHKNMPRSRARLRRPSSYVVRQLAIRISNLARIVLSDRSDIPFAQETIFYYMQDIGIHDTYFERVYLASMRLIRDAHSVDVDYVLGAIAGIFDTMYPHDEF